MAGFTAVVTILGAQSGRTAVVLKAARDIRAGATIASSDLATAQVRIDDPTVMAGLVAAGERDRLVGQVATASVAAGHLVPARLTVSPSASELWEVPLPVKRMPPDLKPGDHVIIARPDKSTRHVSLPPVRPTQRSPAAIRCTTKRT